VGTIKARRRNFRGVDFGVVEPAETFNALEEVLVITRAAAAQPAGPLEGLGGYSFADGTRGVDSTEEGEARGNAGQGGDDSGGAGGRLWRRKRAP
jgi:hypothetical protein